MVLDYGSNEGYCEVCVMGSVSSSRGYFGSIVGISSSEGIDVETEFFFSPLFNQVG